MIGCQGRVDCESDAHVPDVMPEHHRAGAVVVLRYVETPVSAAMVHAVMGDPASIAGQPFLAGGSIVTVGARPYVVLEDSDEVVALFQPAGTPLPRWVLAERRYLENPQRAPADSLRLLYPGRPYDVTLFFDPAGEPPWFYDELFGAEGLQAGWREQRRLSGGNDEAKMSTERPSRGVPGRFRGWYVNLQSPFRHMPFGYDIVDLTLDIVARPDRSWYLKDVDELEAAVRAGACTQAFSDALHRAAAEVTELIEAAASPFDATWLSRRLPFGTAIDVCPDGWQDDAGIQDPWWSIE